MINRPPNSRGSAQKFVVLCKYKANQIDLGFQYFNWLQIHVLLFISENFMSATLTFVEIYSIRTPTLHLSDSVLVKFTIFW